MFSQCAEISSVNRISGEIGFLGIPSSQEMQKQINLEEGFAEFCISWALIFYFMMWVSFREFSQYISILIRFAI